MKKPSTYKPETAREILEAELRRLKREAGEPEMAKALLTPTWQEEKTPGAELVEFAPLAEMTLWAAKPTEATHRRAPEGAFRISWSLWSKSADDTIAGGGATSMEEAKEFAYLAYQAAYGFIRGGDA